MMACAVGQPQCAAWGYDSPQSAPGPPMIIQPRTWEFICTTSHPRGCALNVRDQIAYTAALGRRTRGPRRVLVIGASTGYGLAARITAAFGFGAATLGLLFEKPARGKKTATAGWYNTAAFHRCADAAGLTALSLNGDAFSDAARAAAIELIRTRLGGPVDLVIYSLAAPARTLPATGERVRSVLKPIGKPFSGTTIDTERDALKAVVVEPAVQSEIDHTIQVMGGDDWALWIRALRDAGVLTADARTVAFSYIGPALTWAIYREGTIGRAKQDLERRAQLLGEAAGNPDFARVAILKSVVTQSSAAIPVIPLYISLVFRVMQDKGLHEGAIEQQNRLFRDFLYPEGEATPPDADGRLRLDEREMRDDVQSRCRELWGRVNAENFRTLGDYAGYKHAFLNLFGFERDDVDYDLDVDPAVEFPHESL